MQAGESDGGKMLSYLRKHFKLQNLSRKRVLTIFNEHSGEDGKISKKNFISAFW